MRILRRHWAIALVLSAVLHALVAWSMTSRPDSIEIERAAGAPVAVSAVSLATAFESETEEIEPTEVSETLDAVRPEPVEPQRQTAKLNATQPERTAATETATATKPVTANPTPPAPNGSVQPVAALPTPTEMTGPKLARVTSPDAVALPVTRETAPRSTARPETLTRSQPDTVPRSEAAALKAETATKPETIASAVPNAVPSAIPQAVQSATPVTLRSTRQEVTRTEPRPAESDETPSAPTPATPTAAQPVRVVSPRVEPTTTSDPPQQTAALKPDGEAPIAQANTTATRIEAVDSELAESAIPLAKPQRQAALTPKAEPQPTQTRTQKRSERRAQQAPKRAEKKKEAPRRKTASRGNAGQTGSKARGRRAQQAGDGGRRRGVSGKADMSNYLGKVVSRLQRQKRYPSDARRKRIEGTAVVAFVISPNGSVGGIRLRKSAGNPALDKAALAMVRRAAPFPPFPKNSGRNRMPISVPVRFAVR